ncbi:MFS transporter, partial [Bacillus cytotoxicus]|uniref:MFS transporter n=1 Tax=Bacillus cytotoxicus TaxID=580165 RepID=UPI003D7EA5FB
MFKWLKPAPAIERLPADMIDKVYRLLRIRVLIGISVGYAAYYLVRSNFTLSSTYLMKEYGFSTTQIGLLGSVVAIVYGLSKFFMGNLSDKAYAQRFIAVGLFLSAIINICFGFASHAHQLKNFHYPQVTKNVILSKKLARKGDIFYESFDSR